MGGRKRRIFPSEEHWFCLAGLEKCWGHPVISGPRLHRKLEVTLLRPYRMFSTLLLGGRRREEEWERGCGAGERESRKSRRDSETPVLGDQEMPRCLWHFLYLLEEALGSRGCRLWGVESFGSSRPVVFTLELRGAERTQPRNIEVQKLQTAPQESKHLGICTNLGESVPSVPKQLNDNGTWLAWYYFI